MAARSRRRPAAAAPTRGPGGIQAERQAAMQPPPGKATADIARPCAVLCVLALLAAAVFWQVRDFAFIGLDDQAYVAENPMVLRGLSAEGLRWAVRSVHAANWHPLTWLSHMLDVQLFGPDPGRHHLVNAGLHLLNAALLFLGLRALTGGLWRPAAVAALFAVHPAHVESVAWIAERKDLLSTLLLLLTILAYERHARRRSAGWYVATIGCFALGLLAKPMLVTLPFVLLLLDYWPLGRLAPARPGDRPGSREGAAAVLLEKLPLFLLTAASSAATFIAQSRSDAVASLEHLALGARAANALVSYLRYLGIMVWPADLAVIYPYPRSDYPATAVLAALLALSAGTVLAVHQRRRRPALLVGWLWFGGMLVPVIGLVQVGNQALADRYTYMPFTGLFIALVWSLAGAAGRGTLRAGLSLLAGAAIVGLTVVARRQAALWSDGVTLMRHAVAVTRDNHAARFSLGSAYAKAGRFPEAAREFEASIAINPSVPRTHSDLGNVYAELGQPEKAAAAYRRALALRPDHLEAAMNLGVLALDQGNYADAARAFERITGRGVNVPEVYFNHGLALSGLGRTAEAAGMYRQAVALRPNYARALLGLAEALESLGRREEAGPFRQRALAPEK